MNNLTNSDLSKVPEVTLLYWIIKIATAALGDWTCDTASMPIDSGYFNQEKNEN